MQFLKILFWVMIAVVLYGFSRGNWHEVELSLWGDTLIAIKVPVLMGLMFLLGFLPNWLVQRARIWTLQRRLDSLERQRVAAIPAPPPAAEEEPAR